MDSDQTTFEMTMETVEFHDEPVDDAPPRPSIVKYTVWCACGETWKILSPPIVYNAERDRLQTTLEVTCESCGRSGLGFPEV
jgi:hypothetical protein